MMEQLSLRKFLLASLFTFMISMALVTFFLDSPLNAAAEPEKMKLIKINTDDEGTMPMFIKETYDNSTPPYVCDASQTKSKMVMFLLSFFVGGLAVDRFIMGYTCIGVAKLLVPTCGIWQLVDWILILTGGLYMANGCALIQDM
ncbi:predicted protein [Naegleria gruberi]|uniref:Predicted protein n=1 Tax=Naegleria gruberi TaxID=5762 RepID=D2V632_NAEGR|nr:uncharacterized protein NAEGRDRAFT_64293 [Naegleria gruberi]EFC47897.1 predicted protein [Naegleria gruberi]|eukprot:XP_002680641.1 predicted protein [Naegleria gruberi strain NEG-M]